MKHQKVRWGVLSTSNFALKKTIPAMQLGEWSEISAIASRNLDHARKAASELGIPKAYGSYEELLADPQIEAVYNPLPNHLHVPWTINAAEGGKHVLCEKPIALNAAEAASLLDVRRRTGVRIGEAFMVRTHPQWVAALDLIRNGRIGRVRSVAGYFSYLNRDAENIRNIADYGGGGLLDIGCYLIYTTRLAFGEEPTRVVAVMEEDPLLHTDVLTSGLLHFPSGQAIFTCSTQAMSYQRMQIVGEKGRIEIEIPFNAPPDQPCRLFVDNHPERLGRNPEVMVFAVCNQYTIQGDLFSRSIREGSDTPVPLEDSISNMAVIDAMRRSARSGAWEKPGETR